MKNIKYLTRFLLIFILSNLSLIAKSQITERTNRVINLPDIPGYKTLKCDFHMHTVFSDGHVWPSFRVNEAIRDGLDVISLTEHIDYEGFPEVIARNYNQSYDIAVEAAKNKNLMIIKGLEISPRVPPYHNNALFIKDANILPSDYMKNWKKKFIMKDTITHEQLLAPFLEAKKQDAFVFYNHPGYSWWDKKDTAIFTTFHKELLERKILKGVEVVNSGVYNILAHRLAMKYNLTMVCNTDEHYDNSPRYAKTHRPMTLVFAKEKTAESLKEAMLAGRTALYFDDYLVARQLEADAFFKAAIQVSTERQLRNGEPILNIKLFNNSDIPFKIQASADFDIERYPFGQVTLPAHDTTTITLKAIWKYPESTPLRMKVLNLITSPDEVYQTVFNLSAAEIKK
ncbi:MAG: phosphotransferase [Sphingobacteriales bacterium 17-39-43]|uniref:Sb-PDE family phosphodiesterase n=1 Tax=Daejeonella sp. TaxID=2805397 RepID=UPI000BCB1C1D|nr:Sb-PDE family phosphodiesterase [Daejeonella sp.]OYZ33144.1 MAG: phosphotransferase [Sphingobacteriales bacterium 16-39-50]OZA26553.1 MAG: phosphotransferase [Sphingobacteriales bacterium 17-39-43]HQS50513.1 Sb-PDE family phosphodiesterase [Daejeonella sp.]HQT21708.1 Sb-PDE family phosphodiesterase [Daejeonella sp.]HQT56439.1 Sb-PDE family phosphodiesterase [Daejeonella sp.]